MSERDYAPLSGACVRGLCDKLYDKRKFAGVEIEKMVKDFHDANNTSQIKKLLRVLGHDLISSTNPNVKNGALMGLSSVAVGLGKESVTYLPDLMQPIMACFSEGESRVRYQAAEALFNVVKIARGAVLAQFAPLFGALARLAADPEPQVKQAAELLDRLLKDIVTESAEFDLKGFIPLIRERIYTRNAFARQFIISWVCVLDSVPDIDLVPYLPDLLDGLFKMLDDNTPEIRKMCEIQLNEFMINIKKDPSRVDFQAMINILIVHAQSSEEMVQLTAITWLKEFVELSGEDMLAHVGGVLAAVLPCLAYQHDHRSSTRLAARAAEQQLRALASPALLVAPPASALLQLLKHASVHTRAAALDWLLHLYHRLPQQMCGETDQVFARAIECLTDSSDEVVRRALAVLAEICSCHDPAGNLESSPYYHKFLEALLGMLAADENLLEDRGAFIIRQVCVLLSAEQVYGALAERLREERALRFAAAAVQVLSSLLLTAAELLPLRALLRRPRLPRRPRPAARLFRRLYLCWCHSPVALVALCLLSHHYRHCCRLIHLFGELEITVDFLTEIDKLVQLIESPIFAYLRLELLQPDSGPLRAALSGLLMLLPQAEAFHTLRRRLQCAPSRPDSPSKEEVDPDIDFDVLTEEFKRVQEAHREYKMIDQSQTGSSDKNYS